MNDIEELAKILSEDKTEYQHHIDGTVWRRDKDSDEWVKIHLTNPKKGVE